MALMGVECQIRHVCKVAQIEIRKERKRKIWKDFSDGLQLVEERDYWIAIDERAYCRD